MSVTELLGELAQRGLRISANGDELEIRAPRGALTQALRTQLLENKNAILDLLTQRQRSLPLVQPAPSDRSLAFPLTDIQEAYWVGRTSAFELGNVSIHMYTEIECEDLDLVRFNQAFQRAVERHDMLRAVLLPDGRQKILERVPPYQIEVLDLRQAGPAEKERQLADVRERLSHQVLPIDQWPAFEILASRLAVDCYRIHISIDCLNIDGASLMLLFHDWVRLYQDPGIELPKLELSYRDYVLAERALRDSPSYRKALEYWRNRVRSLPPSPELPLARNPSALKKPRFKHRSLRLDKETWERLKDQTVRLGLTPSAALLTAYAEVLAAWSKDPEFTVNVTLFNRLPMHPQVDMILGDFTSMILLGVDTAVKETFSERVRRLQKQLWSDLEYRNVSGIQVLREFARVQGRTSGAVMPIVFTSFLNLNRRGFEAPLSSLGDLGHVVYQITQTPQVWLDHQVFEESGALVLHWDAVDELFPDGLVDDMLRSYGRLLDRLAAGEIWQDRNVTLVPESQLVARERLNRTAAPFPETLLQTLFEEQVVRRPEQPAIVDAARTLTYRDLSKISNQLGHRLRELGVQPDQAVAVVMEKGWEQVAAVLGTLKAGGAYLPIDANFPKARIELLLRSGHVAAVVTQPEVYARSILPEDLTVLVLDEKTLADAPGDTPSAAQTAESLAYILYTSGSTGNPKGAMIEQKSVVNRMLDVAERFQLKSSDRAIALSALHHDLSVFDIFGMLCVVGGSIAIPEPALLRDPAHWAKLVVDHRVTVWNSVPSFMQMLVDFLESPSAAADLLPRTLRWVIMSGDFIPVDLPDRLRRLLPQVEIVAAGGPTETTVWDICYPIGKVDPAWRSIPYGRPMKNAQYHVLDQKLDPRPDWVPGELYIAGAGLARGYWMDEERTKASFIIHPASRQRLYRSGDVGRYLPDGNIEILGRKDHQVKIRGYRIEAGEIEAVLSQHAGVQSAVVVALGETALDKRLVAYVVPRDGATEGRESAHVDGYSITSTPGETAGVIQDPLERIDFKMKKLQLRHAEQGQVRLDLMATPLDEERKRQYIERQTYRTFHQQPITLADFSRFLSCLSEISLPELPLPKYRYASAGGLYPVQVYLYVKPGRVQGIEGGSYYYHPKDHCLLLLSGDARLDRSAHYTVNQDIFDQSAFSIFLVAQMSAITPMYGELARDFCLLEAGYMSQLMMSAGPASQIGLCPIGSMNFDKIRGVFQLEETHLLVHSHLGGLVDPTNPQAVAIPHLETWRSVSGGQSQGAGADGTFVAELRDFLSLRLPEYMVPAAFVLLESLPLTVNGKVDRKALPLPEETARRKTAAYTAPKTDLERLIAGILKDILKVEEVGTQDNFFDLGANSVHMVQANTRLREALNLELSVVEMFKHPTINALAAHLSDEPEAPSSIPEVQERARKQIQAIVRQRKRVERQKNG